MEAPKCKICGDRHYGVRCLRSDAPKGKSPAARALAEFQALKTDPLYKEALAAVTPASAKFDRTAYQREYMRQRRAKKRAESQGK